MQKIKEFFENAKNAIAYAARAETNKTIFHQLERSAAESTPEALQNARESMSVFCDVGISSSVEIGMDENGFRAFRASLDNCGTSTPLGRRSNSVAGARKRTLPASSQRTSRQPPAKKR